MLDGSFAVLSFFKAIVGWKPDIILSTSPSLCACVPVAVAKAILPLSRCFKPARYLARGRYSNGAHQQQAGY